MGEWDDMLGRGEYATPTYDDWKRRAEAAEADRDHWKRQRDRAVETCRFRHQDGLTAEEWHTRICGAMQGAVRERERAEAAEAEVARLIALVEAGLALHADQGGGWCAECSESPCKTRAALRGAK